MEADQIIAKNVIQVHQHLLQSPMAPIAYLTVFQNQSLFKMPLFLLLKNVNYALLKYQIVQVVRVVLIA
jgi:hypothetical protein